MARNMRQESEAYLIVGNDLVLPLDFGRGGAVRQDLHPTRRDLGGQRDAEEHRQARAQAGDSQVLAGGR